METSRSYKPFYTVYPGQYVPMLEEADVQEKLKEFGLTDIIRPPVNISESENSVTIEISMPGVERDELVVSGEGNMLSVCVLHKECAGQEEAINRCHEFSYTCYDRHILLPENADTEFSHAEYKAGVLHIHVLKSDASAASHHTRIAVY
jgi:HSP20 family protein